MAAGLHSTLSADGTGLKIFYGFAHDDLSQYLSMRVGHKPLKCSEQAPLLLLLWIFLLLDTQNVRTRPVFWLAIYFNTLKIYSYPVQMCKKCLKYSDLLHVAWLGLNLYKKRSLVGFN